MQLCDWPWSQRSRSFKSQNFFRNWNFRSDVLEFLFWQHILPEILHIWLQLYSKHLTLENYWPKWNMLCWYRQHWYYREQIFQSCRRIISVWNAHATIKQATGFSVCRDIIIPNTWILQKLLKNLDKILLEVPDDTSWYAFDCTHSLTQKFNNSL